MKAEDYMVANEHLGLENAHVIAVVAMEGHLGNVVSHASYPLKNIREKLLLR